MIKKNLMIKNLMVNSKDYVWFAILRKLQNNNCRYDTKIIFNIHSKLAMLSIQFNRLDLDAQIFIKRKRKINLDFL